MNKLFSKIFVAAGAAFSLVACNQKVEFTSESFVAFGASSVNVSEDAGYIDIPVYAYAKNGDYAFPRGDSANTTVVFEVVPGTAVEGENYTVEPQTGVLTFSNSSESSIRVNVVDHDGEINNAANFTIRLVSADSGFTLGGLRETRVTIQDADNPLAHLYGTYRSGTLTDLWGAETTLELVISAVDGSTTEVSIEGLSPTAASYGLTLEPVIGSVSGNLMTLASEQTLASTEGLGVAGDEIFFSSISTFTSSGFNWGTALVFTIDEDAMTLTAAPFGYGIAYLAEEPNSYGFVDGFFVEEGATFTKVQ